MRLRATFACPISSPQPVNSASLFLVTPCLPSKYAVEALSRSMYSEVRSRRSPMLALRLHRARADRQWLAGFHPPSVTEPWPRLPPFAPNFQLASLLITSPVAKLTV